MFEVIELLFSSLFFIEVFKNIDKRLFKGSIISKGGFSIVILGFISIFKEILEC